MSYENTIKAKHEFQDSLSEFLTFLSAMTYREIELATAKIADSLSNNDVKIHRESAMFSGNIAQLFLELRNKGEILENERLRRSMKKRKAEFIGKIATIERIPELLAYEEEEKKIIEIRKHQTSENANLVKKWLLEYKKQPFLKRLFGISSIPEPQKRTLTELPTAPKSLSNYEQEISRKLDLGELLIHMVSHYSFSYIDQSSDFVNEDNVKSFSIKLTEIKR